MANFSSDDLTKGLIEPDTKYGKFEPDPNDQFIQRYVPTKSERESIEDWLKEEIDQAIEDEKPSRQRKLSLLRAYNGQPEGQSQILVLPLIKRAVNQNVAWIKNTIMQKRPLVSVSPDSDNKITVLVPDPTFGPVPIEKSSEEVASSVEMWLEYKLRKRMPFDQIVETACFEAKRGQTPTWLKISHREEHRTIRAPKFQQSGPVAVTFRTKEEVDVIDGEPTIIENVSTYAMLLPADEQDAQKSRWLAYSDPQTKEQFRRCLYNDEYFLIPKADWEDMIEDGADSEQTEDAKQKADSERRVAAAPKSGHDIREVWFFWTVPMKQTLVSIDGDTGEQTQKTQKINQEYSFVGHFHRKLGRLCDMIRIPFDHGQRPFVPIFDRKEPFRMAGGSIAEDVWPYQNVISQLNSLEIRGGVIATTPVTFADPGSTAGEWVAVNPIEPGSIIPRLRPEEIEIKPLGERPQSLLGLIEFHNKEYEKQTQIGDLQLGLELPGRTPASTMAQVTNAGETQAAMFLDTFRRDLSDAIKLYVQTVQQYMRFGEVIPFDAETKATVMAALGGQQDTQGVTPDDLNAGMPMRFPMEPIHQQFAFNITASSEDRSQQGDFEKLVALKKLIDADGAIVAQMTGPIASGKMPDSVMPILIEQFKRSEKAMELIAKAMRKDGDTFAINPKLMIAMAQEQKQLMAAKAAQPPAPPPPQVKVNVNLAGQLPPQDVEGAASVAGIGGMSGPQGAGIQPGGGMPPVPNHPGALAVPVHKPGLPGMPVPNQGGSPQPGGQPIGQPR